MAGILRLILEAIAVVWCGVVLVASLMVFPVVVIVVGIALLQRVEGLLGWLGVLR